MAYYGGILLNVDSRRKCVHRDNVPRLIVGFLLMILLFSSHNICSSLGNSSSRNSSSVKPAEISNLPSASITINILGALFGNQIKAGLDFNFQYDAATMMYRIGFSQQNLVITDSILFKRAIGLGYDEIRVYPYAYTDNGMLADFWVNHTPNYDGRGNYPAWTPSNNMSLYFGPFSEETMTHFTKAGDIIEFENLTIYFDDGSSFVCGPQLITVGVNFTRQNDGWQTDYLLGSSDSQNTIFHESALTVHLQKMDPISIPFLELSFVIVIAIVVSFTCYRYRIKRRISKTHAIELNQENSTLIS